MGIRIGLASQGTVTSGDWGHRSGRNLAMGFVGAAAREIGTELQVEILGDVQAGKVIPPVVYDPATRLPRG